MELTKKPNTSSENKQHNKMMKQLEKDPNGLSDDEIDLFLSAIREESDSNMMKYYNPRI